MDKIDKLKFNEKLSLKLTSGGDLKEKQVSDKGDYGLIMEHYTMYELLKQLKEKGFEIKRQPEVLIPTIEEKLKAIRDKGGDERQIHLQQRKAVKVADQIIKDIVESDDAAFLEFDVAFQDSVAGGSADVRLLVRKESAKEVFEEIRISLKSYAGKGSSQGSKTLTKRFAVLFADIEGNLNDANWEKLKNTAKSKEVKDAVQELKEFFDIAKIAGQASRYNNDLYKKFLDSDIFRAITNDRDIEKLSKRTKGLGNHARNAAWAEFLEKEMNLNRKELNRRYVTVFNALVADRLEDQSFVEKLRKEVLYLAGIDEVLIYNAINTKNKKTGEDDIAVKSYNSSPGFKKLVEAAKKLTRVEFEESPGVGTSFIIKMFLDKEEIFRYNCYCMYIDGTVQVKADSTALEQGRLN